MPWMVRLRRFSSPRTEAVQKGMPRQMMATTVYLLSQPWLWISGLKMWILAAASGQERRKRSRPYRQP